MVQPQDWQDSELERGTPPCDLRQHQAAMISQAVHSQEQSGRHRGLGQEIDRRHDTGNSVAPSHECEPISSPPGAGVPVLLPRAPLSTCAWITCAWRHLISPFVRCFLFCRPLIIVAPGSVYPVQVGRKGLVGAGCILAVIRRIWGPALELEKRLVILRCQTFPRGKGVPARWLHFLPDEVDIHRLPPRGVLPGWVWVAIQDSELKRLPTL